MAAQDIPRRDVIAARFGDKDSITLSPFGNQVGGHFVMITFDDFNIAKPIVPREHFFYESMGERLFPFIPQYQGDITVSFEEGEERSVRCIGRRKKEKVAAGSTTEEMTVVQRHDLRLGLSGSQNGMNGHHKAEGEEVSASPWASKCWDQLEALVKKSNPVVEYDHIVLENVTAGFRKPSILDLKMGTQSHSDVMSEEKKKVHIDRCASTTSSSLGIRFCGLQLYDASTKKYIYKDKFVGRNFTPSELDDEITSYLCGGDERQTKAVLLSVLEKVKALEACVRKLDSVRLFSVSILLIYEGHYDSDMRNSSAEVRLIDFANATHNGYTDDPVKYIGADEGFCKGLATLAHIATRALNKL